MESTIFPFLGFLVEFFFSENFPLNYMAHLGALMSSAFFVLCLSTLMHGLCKVTYVIFMWRLCIAKLEHLSFSFLQENYCYHVMCNTIHKWAQWLHQENYINKKARAFWVLMRGVSQHHCTRRSLSCLVVMDFVALQRKILQINIRLLRDCTKEEIEKCFGPIVNKNEHQYIKCLNPKLITKVEKL